MIEHWQQMAQHRQRDIQREMREIHLAASIEKDERRNRRSRAQNPLLALMTRFGIFL
jgi:hypothetical protein